MNSEKQDKLDETYITDFEHIEVCPKSGVFELSSIREYFKGVSYILPDPLNPSFFYICPWLGYIKTQMIHRIATGYFCSYLGALVLYERRILIKTDVIKEEGELAVAFLKWLFEQYDCSIKNDCGRSITQRELGQVFQLEAEATEQ